MKKILLSILLLGAIYELQAEDTQKQADSLRLLLKSSRSDTGMVKILNELSADLIIADQYSEALKCANEALSLSKTLNYQPGIASAYRKIGVNYTQQGDYARALEFLFKSLRINEALKNNEEIFKLHDNIGNVYLSQENYSSALNYFMKAYSYKKNDGLTNANIGNTYMIERKFDLSLKYLLDALKNYRKINDQSGISDILNNIGTVYEYQNKIDSAFKYYNNALAIKTNIGDRQGVSDALASLGDILFKQKKYKMAIEYENKSLKLAKKIGYLISAEQTEQKLNEIYDTLGDKDEAYLHYKNYIAIKDSLYNEEETKKTVREEMNFEFYKKEAVANAIHTQKLKHQQILRNIFIFGFIIILIFSVFQFRSFKREQKQKAIIEEQKLLVEHKNKEITDSINYAQRIQRAILPSEEYMNKLFPEHFVCYKPKDIVSGDFYWAFTDGESKYFATADCTGHSIPGAMMSMIGSSLLNEIVIERKITSPEIILNTLREEIIKAINQEGADEERKDGMDISFVKITGMHMECACANNQIYVVRNGELIEIKANRFPCGKYVSNESFTLNKINLQKSDIIYTLSDGFVDQFSEKTGKKLMSKRFKQWITELSPLNMAQTKSQLESRFNEWIGSSEQIDDVSVVAVKI